MKNKISIIIATFVVIMLGAYAVCFQVRYDQVAVKTTFDSANQDSIIDKAGLHFSAPWPFQKVYSYSTRLQVLEDQLEEQQTADEKAVIIRTYVAWRITDPLSFFTRLETVNRAEEQMIPLLRTTRGIISQYGFEQLVNTDASKLKLSEIEDKATQQLQARITDSGYGITVEKVGIRRVMLPEKTTESVFDTMKKTRERMAANARQEGKAKAAAIKSDAETAAKRMKAIAERRAQAIRAKGDREASKYYASFAADKEDFAIFLFKNEALKEMLKNNSTFVLPAEDLGLFDSVGQVKLPDAK
jgi:membrane protease subunit HflC